MLLSQAIAKQHEQMQNPGVHSGRQSQVVHPYGSPQRRYLSEGELVRQGAELSYARTNNTVDNIRELASSPQHGVYMWKDNSPGYNGNQVPPFPGAQNQPNIQNYIQRGPQQPQTHHQQMPHLSNQQSHDTYNSRHRSNPTSPTQQYCNNSSGGNNGGVSTYNNSGQRFNPMPITTSSGYHPALRGGVPVFPPQPSPQIKRKATPTRPISFVRALEMADSMEMQAMSNNGGADKTNMTKNNGLVPGGTGTSAISNNGGNGSGNPLNNTQSTTPTPDRASVYDINYEISV